MLGEAPGRGTCTISTQDQGDPPRSDDGGGDDYDEDDAGGGGGDGGVGGAPASFSISNACVGATKGPIGSVNQWAD